MTQFLTKLDVRELAEANNCTTTFDHDKRIMYIMGDKAGRVLDLIKSSNMHTAFKIEGKTIRIPISENH